MDLDAISLRRVWTLVSSVLSALSALPGFGGSFLPGPMLAQAFCELRLAEAAARRALFFMAASEPSPVCPAPTALPAPRDLSVSVSNKTAGSAPTTPALFNLSDPLPDILALAGLIETTGPTGPIVSTGGPRPIAGLKARMAALQAVLEDPGPSLKRFIARRDRPRRHLLDRGNAPRLRLGDPPGFVPRRALEWAMDVLMEIHELVICTRAPPPGVLD
ncbi:MAG: hypothetical protein AAGI03_12035 [Pseudomonadota bacterium]